MIKIKFMQWITSNLNLASGRLAQLKCLLFSDRLYLQSKVTLYKILIRPEITLAAPAWAFATNTHIKKVEIFQNQVLKLTTKRPLYTR